MKNFFRSCMLLFCAGMLLCCSACTTEIEPDYDFKPTPGQKMTDQELKKLMSHARIFVSEASKVKLTDAQRQIVRTTDPK